MGMFGDLFDSEYERRRKHDKRRESHERGELQGTYNYDRGMLYRGPQAFSGHQTAESNAQSRGGAEAQNRALDGLNQSAASGWSGLDAMQNQRAMTQTSAMASQQAQGAQRQAASQGQLQGGAALRGAMRAQNTGADQAANAGQAFAAQGADRRAAAGQGQMALGGQMSQESLRRAASGDAFNMWAKGMADQGEATVRANDIGERNQDLDETLRMAGRVTAMSEKIGGMFSGGYGGG